MSLVVVCWNEDGIVMGGDHTVPGPYVMEWNPDFAEVAEKYHHLPVNVVHVIGNGAVVGCASPAFDKRTFDSKHVRAILAGAHVDFETRISELPSIYRKSARRIGQRYDRDPEGTLVIAGYDYEGLRAVPKILEIELPSFQVTTRELSGSGHIWYGETEVLERAFGGADEALLRKRIDEMSIDDMGRFCGFAVEATTQAQNLKGRDGDLKGTADVCLVTPDETKWIRSIKRVIQ